MVFLMGKRFGLDIVSLGIISLGLVKLASVFSLKKDAGFASSLIVLLTGCLWLTPVSAKEEVYRYIDDSGRTVMGNKIPPEFVKNGYTVLNKYGQVLKEIAPAPTEEELQALENMSEEARMRERQSALQKAKDEQLLRAFSTVEDAERAMERKFTALDVIIDITKGNISRLNSQLSLHRKKAARIERSGGEVSEQLLEDIESTARQVAEAEAFIVEKKKEKVEVKLTFTKSIERLKDLGR